ncbi:MAG TPA: hypothetical protein DDZ51_23855, partial [Planctomycetaceae bacterium]|nr:hypothetical protein [Planctomycetaceae bacterium]
ARTVSEVFPSSGFAVGASIAYNAAAGAGLSETSIGAAQALAPEARDETAAETLARVYNTAIDIVGDFTINAESMIGINSTVSNAAESTASTIYGSKGAAAAGVVATNYIHSSTFAQLEFSSDYELVGQPGLGQIDVGGDLEVSAKDNGEIYANTKLVSSSVITNDGGASLLTDIVDFSLPSDFDSSNVAAALVFGSKVRVLKSHREGGDTDTVYTYLGTGLDEDGNPTTFDLTQVDFSDLDDWLPPPTALIPPMMNVDQSDSVAVGGVVTMNDVRGGAFASIQYANINAGAVSVAAIENATIQATVDSTVESSGGSAFGEGTSLAVNGTIATNIVLNSSSATISHSVVQTTAVGTSEGGVYVWADNSSQIDATNDSVTKSGDTAGGGMLAFNTIGYLPQNALFNTFDTLLTSNIGKKQPAATTASLVNTKVIAAGDVDVLAESTSSIESTVSNATTSAASALTGATGMAIGGVLASNMVASDVKAFIDNSGITDAPDRLVQASGNITVDANDSASIVSDTRLLADSTTTNDGGTSLIGDFLTSLIMQYEYSSTSGTKDLTFGDKVRVASIYELPEDAVDDENFEGEAVYQYMGTAGSIDLATTDYSDFGLWKKLEPFNVPGAGLNFSDSDSVAVGGLVVRNDVDGNVKAYLSYVTATSVGDITITATGNQNLEATTDSTVSSSGGSAYGAGTSLAVNGVIVTNNMTGFSEAYTDNSTITTASAGNEPQDAKGDFSLRADNTASFTAINTSSTQSGDTAAGVTLAFNRLGYAPDNLLFNTLEAIFGTILGGDDPVGAKAWMRNTPVTASGDMSVIAHNDALLTAEVTNATASSAGAITGANGMAAAAIVASNMVESQASVTVDFTDAYLTA